MKAWQVSRKLEGAKLRFDEQERKADAAREPYTYYERAFTRSQFARLASVLAASGDKFAIEIAEDLKNCAKDCT